MFKSNSLLLSVLLLVSTGSQLVAIDLVAKLSPREQEDVRANNGFTHAQATRAAMEYVLERTSETPLAARATVRQVIDALFSELESGQTRISIADLEDAISLEKELTPTPEVPDIPAQATGAAAARFVASHPDDKKECGICLDEIEPKDKNVLCGHGECKHTFHTKCIEPWLATGKTSCPTCRKAFIAGAQPAAIAMPRPDVAAYRAIITRYDDPITLNDLLFLAIRARQADHVLSLIAAGADVNAIAGVNAIHEVNNGTPLMLAAELGDLEIAEILILNGANVHTEVYSDHRVLGFISYTALSLAIDSGHAHIVNTLRFAGAIR